MTHPIASALEWLTSRYDNEEVFSTYQDFIDSRDVPDHKIETVRYFLYSLDGSDFERRNYIDELIRFMDDYTRRRDS